MSSRYVGLAVRLTPLLLCLAAAPARAFTEDEIRRYTTWASSRTRSSTTKRCGRTTQPTSPTAGFFDFRKYNNWEPTWYAPEITVPGNGVIVFTYAVLLTETDKATFTDQEIPRAVLLDHAMKAIRWCCLTSAYVDHPYKFPIPGGYERRMSNGSWVRPIGHRTDVLGWLTVGAAMLWDKLDTDGRGLVEKVCVGAAPKQRYPRSWEIGQGGNQDVVKQDLGSTIGAAYLFPQRLDHNLYMDLVRAAGIDIVSTLHDRACTTMADGRPVRDWAGGWNLYPDYSRRPPRLGRGLVRQRQAVRGPELRRDHEPPPRRQRARDVHLFRQRLPGHPRLDGNDVPSRERAGGRSWHRVRRILRRGTAGVLLCGDVSERPDLQCAGGPGGDAARTPLPGQPDVRLSPQFIGESRGRVSHAQIRRFAHRAGQLQGRLAGIERFAALPVAAGAGPSGQRPLGVVSPGEVFPAGNGRVRRASSCRPENWRTTWSPWCTSIPNPWSGE